MNNLRELLMEKVGKDALKSKEVRKRFSQSLWFMAQNYFLLDKLHESTNPG